VYEAAWPWATALLAHEAGQRPVVLSDPHVERVRELVRTEVLPGGGGSHLVGEVVTIDGHAAVALPWVAGTACPKDDSDSGAFRQVPCAPCSVRLAGLDGLFEQPHGDPAGDRWDEVRAQAVERVGALGQRAQLVESRYKRCRLAMGWAPPGPCPAL